MPQPPNLQYLLLTQRGVVSRAQALASGQTKAGLEHRLRPGGTWQRLLPGVYLTGTGTPTREQLTMAAQLFAGPGGFITGFAALEFYGISGPRRRAVDVLVPASCRSRTCGFAALHSTRRMPQAWSHDLAARYVLVPRAVADALAGLPPMADARTIVASAVQQRLCTIAQLAGELGQRHRARDALLRTVLAEVADGVRSAPEGDLRALITSAGLPAPLYNPRLFLNGTFLASPDAWWPGSAVAVEVDSRQWHLLPEDWERTMSRHRRMIAAGIFVIHVSPAQLRGHLAEVTSDIASALARGRPAPGVTWRAAA